MNVMDLKIGIKHFPLGKQDRICPILERNLKTSSLLMLRTFLDW